MNKLLRTSLALLLCCTLPAFAKTPSITDIVTSDSQFQTLAAAVKAAGLAEALGSQTLTVFAPTDEAFAEVPKETLQQLLTPEGKEQLVAILTYHVVPGSVSAGDALNAGEAKSLNGAPLAFSFENGSFKVDEAKVLTVNVEASNGRIHVIDRVIMPPAKPTKVSNAGSIEQGVKLVQTAIAHGVPIFNEGDHAGCATVYQAAGKHILALQDLPASITAPITESQAKARKDHNARSRAWTLRAGLDDAYAAMALVASDMDASSQSAEPSTTSGRLIDFNEDNPAAMWKTVNDNVMGGRSKGGPSFSDGTLTFSGSTNTDGGGFSSIRTQPKDWNISRDAEGIVLRYKADGRTYQVDLRKQGVSNWTAYRAEFATKKTWSWREVRIPFSDFKPTVMGRSVDAAPIRGDQVEAVGLFIYDKKDGPFKIHVDWIDTY